MVKHTQIIRRGIAEVGGEGGGVGGCRGLNLPKF